MEDFADFSSLDQFAASSSLSPSLTSPSLRRNPNLESSLSLAYALQNGAPLTPSQSKGNDIIQSNKPQDEETYEEVIAKALERITKLANSSSSSSSFPSSPLPISTKSATFPLSSPRPQTLSPPSKPLNSSLPSSSSSSTLFSPSANKFNAPPLPSPSSRTKVTIPKAIAKTPSVVSSLSSPSPRSPLPSTPAFSRSQLQSSSLQSPRTSSLPPSSPSLRRTPSSAPAAPQPQPANGLSLSIMSMNPNSSFLSSPPRNRNQSPPRQPHKQSSASIPPSSSSSSSIPIIAGLASMSQETDKVILKRSVVKLTKLAIQANADSSSSPAVLDVYNALESEPEPIILDVVAMFLHEEALNSSSNISKFADIAHLLDACIDSLSDPHVKLQLQKAFHQRLQAKTREEIQQRSEQLNHGLKTCATKKEREVAEQRVFLHQLTNLKWLEELYRRGLLRDDDLHSILSELLQDEAGRKSRQEEEQDADADDEQLMEHDVDEAQQISIKDAELLWAALGVFGHHLDHAASPSSAPASFMTSHDFGLSPSTSPRQVLLSKNKSRENSAASSLVSSPRNGPQKQRINADKMYFYFERINSLLSSAYTHPRVRIILSNIIKLREQGWNTQFYKSLISQLRRETTVSALIPVVQTPLSWREQEKRISKLIANLPKKSAYMLRKQLELETRGGGGAAGGGQSSSAPAPVSESLFAKQQQQQNNHQQQLASLIEEIQSQLVEEQEQPEQDALDHEEEQQIEQQQQQQYNDQQFDSAAYSSSVPLSPTYVTPAARRVAEYASPFFADTFSAHLSKSMHDSLLHFSTKASNNSEHMDQNEAEAEDGKKTSADPDRVYYGIIVQKNSSQPEIFSHELSNDIPLAEYEYSALPSHSSEGDLVTFKLNAQGEASSVSLMDIKTMRSGGRNQPTSPIDKKSVANQQRQTLPSSSFAVSSASVSSSFSSFSESLEKAKTVLADALHDHDSAMESLLSSSGPSAAPLSAAKSTPRSNNAMSSFSVPFENNSERRQMLSVADLTPGFEALPGPSSSFKIGNSQEEDFTFVSSAFFSPRNSVNNSMSSSPQQRCSPNGSHERKQSQDVIAAAALDSMQKQMDELKQGLVERDRKIAALVLSLTAAAGPAAAVEALNASMR